MHTPGPWGYAEHKGRESPPIATVAVVEEWIVGPEFDDPNMVCYDDHGSAEADAKLISAAPELLAALKALQGAVKARNYFAVESAFDGGYASAAIAKAQG
jgi:hypothetical protein